jgi:anti-sigma factor ChrR (cupin superfamily)
MLQHADLSTRAASFADEAEWTPSPMAGAERRMLERDCEEVARAASVVRYRPGSRFSRHEHALGEEFLVLEGAGTYVWWPCATSWRCGRCDHVGSAVTLTTRMPRPASSTGCYGSLTPQTPSSALAAMTR